MVKPTGQRKSKQRTAANRVVQNGANRERAAILIADDDLKPIQQPRRSDQAIADEIGVHRNTIVRWKRDPEFQAMIQDAKGKIKADALRLPIAQKLERIRILNDGLMGDLEARRLRGETYAQRAGTPAEAAREVFGSSTPPWAATGKFVEKPKISANGTIVTEWAYDSALESQINEKLKQAAQELGQWDENINVNHGGSIGHTYHNERLDQISDDERLAKIEALLSGEDA